MHVIASLAERTGGPAQAAIGMACAVARLGHEVAIYTTDRALDPSEAPPPGEPVRRDGVEIRYFREHAPRVFATSFPLARALSARIPQVDLVHIHSLYLFHDWAVGRLCRKYGVPYLLRPHGTLDPYLWQRHRARKWIVERLFQNSVTRHAAALHYTAEDEMRLAEPYALGTPGVVVANGIELAAFAALPPPGRLRAAHPEIGDRRIVLFLGRLNFKKGLDLLIPAFAQTQARHADLQLVIAGPDDGSRADAERLVAAAGIGAH
ncbi:MAG: glycosyltransferase, partial [Proteobacteria bacterium]|nr:glycosyltransferase [Pseudomonadota bacterium]